MENKLRKSPKCNAIILGILLISLIMNLSLSINNYKNKFRVGKEAYNSTLNIRLLNEKNNEILNNSLAKKSISNMDLLDLYKNYANISDNITKLLEEYNYYNENKPFLSSKKGISSQDIVANEVHGRIEEYLNSILQKEMSVQSIKVDLGGEYLEKFKEMKNLSDRIKEYFIDFDKENLNGLEYDDKTNKIIKEYYWVNNLESINNINLDFADINFIINK